MTAQSQPALDPIAPHLGRFVADLKFEDIPDDAMESAKILVLDQIACELVGSTLPWIAPAIELARISLGAVAESTVVNIGLRLPAAEAAFANATFGQACELDDSSYGSAGHMGTATVPVALAMGERHQINGRDFLVAMIGGYEVMYRLMAAIRPHHNARGFHSQSIAGTFASAAVSGKILGLDPDQMTHALAIAGSHSCGSTEYDQSGGEVKRVHAGLAARGGVHSALLAKFGLTGPSTIIEGKRGFCNIFATHSTPSLITKDLGTVFNTQNTWFKVYPAIGTVHTPISAIERLMAERPFKTEDVVAIRVGLAENAMLHGAGITEPTDVVGAQFSLTFSVALAVCKRNNDLANYMDPTLWNDPEIVALMKKVSVYERPDAAGLKVYLACVTIDLKDGSSLETVEAYPRGTPPNPVSPEKLQDKARKLASTVLDARRVDTLVQAVEGMEEMKDVTDLAKLLVRNQTAS